MELLRVDFLDLLGFVNATLGRRVVLMM